ncbi:4930519G04Rik [Phodopus roborovskii]|uniref:4930519G04Rik protein n=1 Tax=Phodopus roborovskii TaxID=109678 RepID=A0AAU9YVE9_PHORO|nr:4930519G04Rik [Phodopus roborovskii]
MKVKLSLSETEAARSWSLSWHIQKYVSWILRVPKEGTETGCCIPDEDVPQRRRHFVHGTRIRLWPPSRVEPTYPNDVSNRVIMEVVPCAFPEEEELSVGKVEPSDKENIILETLRDNFHHHRRSEESIEYPEYPSWKGHRQWDWSSDEEDFEGHSVSVTALVHTEACSSDAKEKAEPAIIRSWDDICKEAEL